MAVLTRTTSKTKFGHDVAVLSLGGADYTGTFTNVGLKGSTEMAEGRSVLDTSNRTRPKQKGYTLDFSKCVESTAPLLALAVGDGGGTAIVCHYDGGPQRTFGFVITSAKLDVNDGMATETITAQSQGTVTVDTGSGTPTARITAGQTRFGKDTASLVIDGSDFINLFKSFTLSIDTQTAEAAAVNDAWKHPRALAYGCTLTVEKVVEEATNFLVLYEAASQTPITCTITITQGDGSGTISISGSFHASAAGLDMPDGADSESITLTADGPLTVTAA